MIDWKQLMENGKQCGIEYHFYDDIELKLCSCGGKARMYSNENKNKKFSFEHLHIVCENCHKLITDAYDISGKPGEGYKAKGEVMEALVKKWNGETFSENSFSNKHI